MKRVIGRFMALVSLAAALAVPATPAQAVTSAVCHTPNPVLNYAVWDFPHAGHDYDVAVCWIRDSDGPLDYFFPRFVFNDDSGGLRNEQNVAVRIEVEKMNMDDRSGRSGFLANCDQDNDWTGGSGDGRGCDKGNYGPSGPCFGFRSVDNSPVAYGIHGCSLTDGTGASKTTSWSETDKVNGDETNTATCDAVVVFDIKWSDGTITGPITLNSAGSC